MQEKYPNKIFIFAPPSHVLKSRFAEFWARVRLIPVLKIALVLKKAKMQEDEQ
jgi:hypothetical protein